MAAEQSKNEKEYARIINELQSLRNEQRNIVNNISTLELDLKEHKWVNLKIMQTFSFSNDISFFFVHRNLSERS